MADIAQTFVVTLQALRGSDGIRNLQILLKTALRRYRLKALDVRECCSSARPQKQGSETPAEGPPVAQMAEAAP
jgi:hypothetical protein